jgi:hypothetical protein
VVKNNQKDTSKKDQLGPKKQHKFDDHDCECQHHVDCVEDVLKAIHFAQKKAKEQHECDTSCKMAISELLGEEKRSKKNTIPFILYCGCKPFKGTGVTTYYSHSDKEKFACIHSFIFKVKKINNGCAVLELLKFKSKKFHSADDVKNSNDKKECSSCSQIHNKDVKDLVGTGICITVDLSCFCAITCLPPICL